MSAFKAYDIRGVYPTEVNETLYYNLGKVITIFLGAKNMVVGYDARPSSKGLFEALVKGANAVGAKVTSIGMTGTEIMYFTAGNKGFDVGVMITASHNPKEYNGLKLIGKGAIPISGDNGLLEIERIIGDLDDPTTEELDLDPEYDEYDPYPEFKEKINSIVDLSSLPKLKVVVDAGNGTGGLVFNKVFNDTPLIVEELYFKPDGTFPNHEANPIKSENLIDLKKHVLDSHADLGISLDGDGDRVVFVDNEGFDSMGYYIFALLIKSLLKKEPGATVVHENRLLWAIEDVVKEYNGVSVRTLAGHSFIKQKMREVNASMGGETSSHFFYKTMYYADSSFLTIVLIFEMIKESGKSLRELLAELKSKYFVSGEINFKVEDAKAVLSRVKDFYEEKDLVADELDGVAFDKARDWHISLRVSNTEPVVRLNVEAKSQELVTKMVNEVEQFIK